MRFLKELWPPGLILFLLFMGGLVGWGVGKTQTETRLSNQFGAQERANEEEVRRLREELLASQRRELDGWNHANKIADLAAKALGERR